VASLDARSVASLLREYAQRIALRGGNPYRAKAYSRAADSLAALAVPLDVLVDEDRLTDVPGVGDAIADIVTNELLDTASWRFPAHPAGRARHPYPLGDRRLHAGQRDVNASEHQKVARQ
jgi:DNA polymerase/3'-5' exonuclease PolX